MASYDDLKKMDIENLVHPFTMLKAHEQTGPTIFETGKGIYLTDKAGHTIIDGFAGLWCVAIGYGREDVAEAAFAQMKKLAYTGSFGSIGNEPSILLAKKLVELTPKSLQHAFFTLGGSDAVDSALKIIRYYWTALGKPEKKHIISLQRGYHGVTWVGAGQTGLAPCHANFGLPFDFQHHIPSHDVYRNPNGPDTSSIIAGSIRDLETKIEQLGGAQNVAAFLAEPVQGAGGLVVPPEGWLKAMRDTCRKHNILFMADEVITGFCRTGSWFGSDHEDLQPDLMSLAKNLTAGYIPMGALMMSDEIYRVLADKAPTGLPFAHGFTYSGHPVSAATALKVIDIYETENFVPHAQEIGAYLNKTLTQAVADHPWVGHTRGQGMLFGVELVADKASKKSFDPAQKIGWKAYAKAYKNGLTFRVMANDTLGFAPPMVITKAEVDLMAQRFRQSLDEAYADEQK
jgi:adenosylmethionine-8-amino-7-oxononanoate aminotransferase